MSISKKLRKPLLFLLLAVLTAALIKSFFIPSSTAVKSSDTVLELDTIWDRAVQGSAVTFTCTIPEDARAGSVLLVNNNSIPFRLLLDGTEFYSYEDPCGERGMALQKIELPENPAGKALVFETKPLSVSSASLFHAFLGNENGIFLHVLFQNLPSIIFSAISAVLGAAVFLVYLVFSGKQVHGSELQTLPPLGAFLLMAGIWVFTDSGAVQLFTGKTGPFVLLSFFSFMLMPYFLLAFIRKMLSEDRRVLQILSWLYLASAGISGLLYIFRIFRLSSILPVFHLLILINIILILRFGIQEIRIFGNTVMKRIIQGLVFLFLFSVAALVIFYANFSAPYSLFYGIGLLIFGIHLIVSAADSFYEHMLKSAEGKIYQRLAYTDVMTRMWNRAAFLKRQDAPASYRSACIMIDINDLKTVNDTCGHQEGDRLICDAADCILKTYDRIGNCYRIGEDEFVVLLDNASEDIVAESLRRLEQHILAKNADRSWPLEIACGYILNENGSQSVKELFNEADKLMYVKKQDMKAKKRREQ